MISNRRWRPLDYLAYAKAYNGLYRRAGIPYGPGPARGGTRLRRSGEAFEGDRHPQSTGCFAACAPTTGDSELGASLSHR
jgi:hypothetical protein